MEYSPKKMKELLEHYGFNLKKKFGQNFIIDENTINSIITKATIDSDTLVIEIGPGAGSLTYKLCQVAKNVLCYEVRMMNLFLCLNLNIIMLISFLKIF